MCFHAKDKNGCHCLSVLCSRNGMRRFFGACVACVQVSMHGWDDSVKLSFLFPPTAEMVGISLPEGAHGWTGAVCYQVFLCNTFTLIVGLLHRIKTCEMFQSRVEIIEEKQFPTEESTPLISLGRFCTLSILLLHFISPLPHSGSQSCCGQIKTTVL